MRATRPIHALPAVIGLAFLALLSTGDYSVRSGDTLSDIAARNDTTVAALAAVNGISDPNRIYVGQSISVTGDTAGGSRPGSGDEGAYTVEAGDTLGAIASRHGTTASAIVAQNDLADPNIVVVGTVLALPPASSTMGTRTPTAGASHHVVTAGETVAGIASSYGISRDQLVAANGLTGGRIYVGQQLQLVPIQASTPSIVCPVQGPMHFANDWGFPRSGGRFHEGNDLFAPRGTPVVATVSGSVAQRTGKLGGNQVRLVGDDGVSYSYTHLDHFGSGGWVTAGTVIGYVGDTGNARGSATHVHFEIHPGGGAAINPFSAVAGAC